MRIYMYDWKIIGTPFIEPFNDLSDSHIKIFNDILNEIKNTQYPLIKDSDLDSFKEKYKNITYKVIANNSLDEIAASSLAYYKKCHSLIWYSSMSTNNKLKMLKVVKALIEFVDTVNYIGTNYGLDKILWDNYKDDPSLENVYHGAILSLICVIAFIEKQPNEGKSILQIVINQGVDFAYYLDGITETIDLTANPEDVKKMLAVNPEINTI